MLIYVKKHRKNKKKTSYGRTDRRTNQNYSSEPHKKFFDLKNNQKKLLTKKIFVKKKIFLINIILKLRFKKKFKLLKGQIFYSLHKIKL